MCGFFCQVVGSFVDCQNFIVNDFVFLCRVSCFRLFWLFVVCYCGTWQTTGGIEKKNWARQNHKQNHLAKDGPDLTELLDNLLC